MSNITGLPRRGFLIGGLANIAAIAAGSSAARGRSAAMIRPRGIKSFDYIIVGAGSAGCALAYLLSEDASVQLLEAGTMGDRTMIQNPQRYYDTRDDPRINWNYCTTRQRRLNGRCIPWPRGRVLGGSSAINAMLYIRGNRLDYDHWETLGNRGWNFESVLPLFKAAENNSRGASRFHGAYGPLSVIDNPRPKDAGMAFIDGAKELGFTGSADFDFNGAVQGGSAGLYQMTVTPGGLRADTAKAFLDPIRGRQSLQITSGAYVTKVLVEGGRAGGVQYYYRGDFHEVRARREVLLCTGTLNSPKLMANSGIGDPDELQSLGIPVIAPLPGVGQNLEDHPVVWMNYASSRNFSPTFASGVVAGLFFHVAPAMSNSWPNMQYHYEVSGSPDATTIGFGVTLVRPQSRGRVRLASANPFEPPVIDPRYLENERDMSAMVSGVELTQRFLQTKTFSSIIKQDGSFGLGKLTREDIESYLRANISTIYHPTGTCKMGSDATAVVDSELRVRGIDGLRVVDASIMPTITTGNTNAPTIMIAYKAASMIRRKLTSEHGTERREVAA